MNGQLSVDMRPLRHSHDLRLLFGGRTISQLGSAIAMIAAALQAYDLTHSSLAVGTLGVAAAVPMVAGMLIGSAIADAADRRKLILATEAAAGVIVAGLAVNAASGHPRLWLLYLLTAASGAAAGLGGPARSAAVPTLVTAVQVPAAAAISMISGGLACILGAALLARLGPVLSGARFSPVTAGDAAAEGKAESVAPASALHQAPAPAGGGT